MLAHQKPNNMWDLDLRLGGEGGDTRAHPEKDTEMAASHFLQVQVKSQVISLQVQVKSQVISLQVQVKS